MDSASSRNHIDPLANHMADTHFMDSMVQDSYAADELYVTESCRQESQPYHFMDDEHAAFDFSLLGNYVDQPVDALGADAIVNSSHFPVASEYLSVTPTSNSSNAQPTDSEAILSDFVNPIELLKQSIEQQPSSLSGPPHTVSGNTVNRSHESINGPSDVENRDNGTNATVNLDYFQLAAACEDSDYQMGNKGFRSRAATTGGISDSGMGNNYSRHMSSYPSPVPNASLPATGDSSDGDSRVLQKEVKKEVTSPTFIMGQDEADPELQFSSVAEANAWRAFQVQVDYDPTIPTTVEEKRKLVAQMLKAMKSVEYAEDNEGMIRPFREQKHNPIRMEIVCWNILDSCISRHENGPLLAIYDSKSKSTGQIPTFAERMEKIIECLWTQKTICKHLLDAYYMFTFVDDPVCSRNRVVANKNLNKRKGEVMNAGKKALGHSRSNSKSITTKDNSEAPEGLHTPFSTPHRETSARDTSTPMTINSNVKNMTLSSPQEPHETPVAVSSPAEPSRIHQSTMPMSIRNQLINTPANRYVEPSNIGASGFTGHGQSNQSFVRSQSTNAIHALGHYNPPYSPYSREQIAEHFRSYPLPQPVSYQSPTHTQNINRRAMGPAPHPWTNYPGASSPTPSHGHSRKRSQDESEGSDFQPSPQKKAR
ncbi:hypothetical protein AJ79_06084 [Helicocarpus griseus UAMH5409]|uniref:Uncharacterized protein n=1 Tax=Helicocarpus griseus UAMH5409 TaxID=1447875 RepID=A0A2B7X8T8_9EURO|nr:hypothetical protein AJ79_06084 [Helicocarpus griseus UAMH5409]